MTPAAEVAPTSRVALGWGVVSTCARAWALVLGASSRCTRWPSGALGALGWTAAAVPVGPGPFEKEPQGSSPLSSLQEAAEAGTNETREECQREELFSGSRKCSEAGEARVRESRVHSGFRGQAHGCQTAREAAALPAPGWTAAFGVPFGVEQPLPAFQISAGLQVQWDSFSLK